LKAIRRIASIGIIAAVVLSAAVAAWLKYDDERELADQTAPWLVYFAGAFVYALVALGVIILACLCAGYVLRKRGKNEPHA